MSVEVVMRVLRAKISRRGGLGRGMMSVDTKVNAYPPALPRSKQAEEERKRELTGTCAWSGD